MSAGSQKAASHFLAFFLTIYVNRLTQMTGKCASSTLMTPPQIDVQ